MVIRVFESKLALENLFKKEEKLKKGANTFIRYEDEVLTKYIDIPIEQMILIDYEEIEYRKLK